MSGLHFVGYLAAAVLNGAVLFRLLSATLAGELTEEVFAGVFTTVLGNVVAMLVDQVYESTSGRQILQQELQWHKDVIQFGEEVKEWDMSIAMAESRTLRLWERLDTLRVLFLLPCAYDSERFESSVALYYQGVELWGRVRLNLGASEQSFENADNLLTDDFRSYELEFVAKKRTEMMARRMDLEKAVVNFGRSIVQLETALPRLQRSIELELGMHEDVDQKVRGL